MKAMFRVTLKQVSNPTGMTFSTETTTAGSAADAIRKVEAHAKRTWKGEQLVATDVEMIGMETV